jgi:hypothetical protein
MKTHIFRIVKIVGVVIFIAAFFLPAVRSPGTGPGTNPMVGWSCALVAAAATGGIFHLDSAWQGKDAVGAICLILSGWVNPLVFFYLLFSIWARFVVIRRVLAVAILICFAATWVFLFKAPMIPLVGHFVWVAGALMILVGEVALLIPGKPAPAQITE